MIKSKSQPHTREVLPDQVGGGAEVPDNSLCESFPLQEEFNFPIENALIQNLLNNKLLWFLLCILSILLILFFTHGVI